jgi:hypothetical protein
VNGGKTEYMKCCRRKTKENKLKMETMEFEKFQSFNYLGSVVNQNNEIEEIKERINARNKAPCANKQMFLCKLLSKRSNLDYTGQQSDQLLHTLVKRGY